jgi:hypothetical protein
MTGCPFLAPTPQPGFLIQIRRGYSVDCQGLRLSIECDAEGWRAEVRDRDRRTVYSAHRCSERAAKLAAAEYVVFGTGSFRSPEELVRQLAWSEYW